MRSRICRPCALLFLALSLGAGGGFAAPVPPAAPWPGPGEIQFGGTVLVVLPGESRFVLMVRRVTLPQGERVLLDPPRPRTIRLTPKTRLRTAAGVGDSVTTGDLPVGGSVEAIGANRGTGKEVEARLVVLEEGAAPAGRNLLLPTGWKRSRSGTTESISLPESAPGGVYQVEVGPGGARLDQKLTALQPNRDYTLSLRARGDAPRALSIFGEVIGDENLEMGLDLDADLTTDWKTYTQRFTARNLAPDRPQYIILDLGGQPGTVWLADITLTETPRLVPVAASSLSAGKAATAGSPPSARRASPAPTRRRRARRPAAQRAPAGWQVLFDAKKGWYARPPAAKPARP